MNTPAKTDGNCKKITIINQKNILSDNDFTNEEVSLSNDNPDSIISKNVSGTLNTLFVPLAGRRKYHLKGGED